MWLICCVDVPQGVNVTKQFRTSGSTPSITIRGSRSISADNAPLYIIDGSPSSATEFSTLSADDIESVEILKDAASQRKLFIRARASDGVVLVTTKRGKNRKGEVSYNGYLGIQPSGEILISISPKNICSFAVKRKHMIRNC